MDDIKFRAWGVLGGKGTFIYFTLLDSNTFDWEIFDEPPIFQQFTGITTDDGVDIYDGDIISCSEWMGGSMQDRRIEKAVVIFTKGSFWFSMDEHRNYKNPHQLLYYAIDIKVIGNVLTN